MKTKLHKLIGMAVLGVTLQMQSLPAWAALSNTQVTIAPRQGQGYNPIGAYGTLTGARYSADTQQYIGCDDSSWQSQLPVEQGTKPAGIAYCFSTDPKFIAALNAMTDSSYISFRAFPGTGQCSELIVDNGSSNLR